MKRIKQIINQEDGEPTRAATFKKQKHGYHQIENQEDPSINGQAGH